MYPCLCYVVPPHLMKRIAENGNQQQRSAAIKTIMQSERHRGRRQVIATVPFDTPSIAGRLRRTIFDAQNGTGLPGKLVRVESDQDTTDPSVNEAFAGAGATYAMYSSMFGRNSIDNKGLSLDSTVHFDHGYDNAFWDGRQMVYGDGDGDLFGRFTSALEVIGHELTHGITQHEAQLAYWDQPGALNESFSDVFGSLVKQFALKQAFKDADWLIGASLLTPAVKGTGLRSLRDPGSAYDDPVLGKDEQPQHMKSFVETTEDDGGVHLNSGIPNRAFFVACEQLDDQWKPGMVWYKTLCERLKPRSTFFDCAKFTISVAGELFGANDKVQEAVRKAWISVGVDIS